LSIHCCFCWSQHRNLSSINTNLTWTMRHSRRSLSRLALNTETFF
jgi:hypothetical protein